jgi:hypothetical protein
MMDWRANSNVFNEKNEIFLGEKYFLLIKLFLLKIILFVNFLRNSPFRQAQDIALFLKKQTPN